MVLQSSAYIIAEVTLPSKVFFVFSRKAIATILWRLLQSAVVVLGGALYRSCPAVNLP